MAAKAFLNLTAEEILAKLEQMQQLVAFDNRAHSYKIGGKLHVSVTTVLGILDKPALKYWAANVQQEADLAAITDWMSRNQSGDLKDVLDGVKHAFTRYSKKAKDTGTQAHEMIEYLIRQQLKPSGLEAPRIQTDAMYAVSHWKRWAAETGFEPLTVERMIFSTKDQVAGKFDCVCRMPKHLLLGSKKLVLVDWKSAKDLYEEHVLQAIAYHGIFSEMMGIDPAVVGSMLVRLPKDGPGEPEMRAIEWDPSAYKAFLGLAPLYRWRKKS